MNHTRETEPAALAVLRDALRGTPYEGKLYLVGGYVRDKRLGTADASPDLDLVLEGDAQAVATLLWKKRVANHAPVTYPAFGTAMVHIGGTTAEGGAQIEFVTARAETYREGSRKPVVMPGTLQTDAERRDFTCNTLMESLDTGEILDLTGRGLSDLAAKVLRTPLDPDITFAEDPLRMLRACRFSAKLGFTIDSQTYAALLKNADKCNAAHGISFERIRDELTKTLLAPGARRGLELMRETGLLAQFAPELSQMHGVEQNRFHQYDVWEHTLVALSNLPADASLVVRLATLLHDVGKPHTRSIGPADGNVYFYGHPEAGATLARQLLNRLRFSSDEINTVVGLVSLHMRPRQCQLYQWSEPELRRLIRIVGDLRDDLFTLIRADLSADPTPTFPTADIDGLQARMDALERDHHITQATAPLTGQEIMARLSLRPGPALGKIKDALTDAVVAGTLAPDDKDGAEALARVLAL